MQPNHFYDFARPNTVIMWLSSSWMSGCAPVVNATVCEVFSINFAAARCRTKLSSKFCTFSFVLVEMKTPSAKRKSSKWSIWSQECSTHHCRTSENMSKLLLSPAPSRTTTVCLKYFVDAKLPTVFPTLFPTLLYRRLYINPSWWFTMAVQLLCFSEWLLLSEHVLPSFGLNEKCVVHLVENFPMITLHLCEDHQGKHFVEQPYVGNGAEIRHKFCAGLFGKHREQCFLPFDWGISML